MVMLAPSASALSESAPPASAPFAESLPFADFAQFFVAPETAPFVAAIRKHLRLAYSPQSLAEEEILCELAIAQAELHKLESAHRIRLNEERARAAELFDRRTADRYRSDRKAWEKDPAAMLEILGGTRAGAAYLAREWAAIAETLAPDGPGPTFAHARFAVLATGSHWHAARIQGAAARVMAHCIAASDDPERMVQRWITQSAGDDRDDDRRRAAWHASVAIDRAEARAELAATAEDQHRRWSEIEAKLRPGDDARRARAEETSAGTGLGDKTLATEFRLLARAVKDVRKRIESLHKRLDSQRKQRSSPSTATARASIALPSSFAQNAPNAASASPLNEAPRMPAVEQNQQVASALPTITAPANDVVKSAVELTRATAEPARSGKREADERRWRRMRKIDWSDPMQVRLEDVETMTRIEQAKPSRERDALIRLIFGTEAEYRRQSKKFLSWVDARP
jgi:hypothetical protein